MGKRGITVRHIGRSWPGMQPVIEEACPCEQAPCGLVSDDRISPLCGQHPVEAMRSIRQTHRAEECPGIPLHTIGKVG